MAASAEWKVSDQQRRTTRVAHALPITVMGVDATRSPYHDEVTTLNVNCHGCDFYSRYDALKGALVVLEVRDPGTNGVRATLRGRVKWNRRPGASGDLYRTAVELDAPCSLWGIAAPPEDWTPYLHGNPSGPKLLEVLPEPDSPKRRMRLEPHRRDEAALASATTPAEPPSEDLVALFKSSLDRLVSEMRVEVERLAREAAEAAFRAESIRLVEVVRSGMREEAQRTLQDFSRKQLQTLAALFTELAGKTDTRATSKRRGRRVVRAKRMPIKRKNREAPMEILIPELTGLPAD